MAVVETSITKIVWYVVAVWLFEYLSIEQTQMLILAMLMLFDTISWIAKQFKLNKIEITSHRLWQGIIKKMLTIMFLFSFALMFKWVWLDWASYIKFVLSLLIMWEFYSITQNIYSYSTWKKIEEYDVISFIIKSIWDSFLKIIEKNLWWKKD